LAAAEKEVLATLRAAADKLMPGEKPEKAEESMAEAAEPASSEPPESAEAAVKPPSKTELEASSLDGVASQQGAGDVLDGIARVFSASAMPRTQCRRSEA